MSGGKDDAAVAEFFSEIADAMDEFRPILLSGGGGLTGRQAAMVSRVCRRVVTHYRGQEELPVTPEERLVDAVDHFLGHVPDDRA